MNFVDDLAKAVTESPKLSPTAIEQITAFLTEHRDLFVQIGEDATHEFFHALAFGDPEAAYDALLAQVSEPQLLELLRQTGPEVSTAIDRRTQILTHYRNVIDTLGPAALQVLTQLILSAL